MKTKLNLRKWENRLFVLFLKHDVNVQKLQGEGSDFNSLVNYLNQNNYLCTKKQLGYAKKLFWDKKEINYIRFDVWDALRNTDLVRTKNGFNPVDLEYDDRMNLITGFVNRNKIKWDKNGKAFGLNNEMDLYIKKIDR